MCMCVCVLGERQGTFCIPNDRWACIRNWKHPTWDTGVTMKGYIMSCKSLNMCLAAVYETSWHGIINGVTFNAVIVNYYPFQWNSVILVTSSSNSWLNCYSVVYSKDIFQVVLTWCHSWVVDISALHFPHPGLVYTWKLVDLADSFCVFH